MMAGKTTGFLIGDNAAFVLGHSAMFFRKSDLLLFTVLCCLFRPVGAQTPPAELLHCQPAQVLAGAAAGFAEEMVARKAAEVAGLGREEVLARLIFAEALSTGYWSGRCQAVSGVSLFEGIGWGVARRIRDRAGQGAHSLSDKVVYDVVFARNQFRTSFSGRGKPNPFAQALLCPASAQAYLDQAGRRDVAVLALFDQARRVASGIVAELDSHLAQGTPLRHPALRASNFFYPHSERFGEMRPPWAANSDPRRNPGYLPLGAEERPCVEFYDLGHAR